MKVSWRGMGEILAHEALITERYLDTVGVWTIGVGVTDAAGADIRPSEFTGSITVEQGMRMFVDLLPQYEGFVHTLLANAEAPPIAQHEYDALVSLSWNIGSIITIRSQTSGTRARINRGDVGGAIDLWRANSELWKRRQAEVDLARTGEYRSKTFIVAPAGQYGEVLWRQAKRRHIDKAFRDIGMIEPADPAPEPEADGVNRTEEE